MPTGTRVLLYRYGPFPFIRTPSGLPSSFPSSRAFLKSYIYDKKNTKILAFSSLEFKHNASKFPNTGLGWSNTPYGFCYTNPQWKCGCLHLVDQMVWQSQAGCWWWCLHNPQQLSGSAMRGSRRSYRSGPSPGTDKCSSNQAGWDSWCPRLHLAMKFFSAGSHPYNINHKQDLN